ncbi:MAG TPA: NUDIX hydrolase [Dermatophilaceae bacterium]|nr:NUDIX hydrolase [Dermatophilaceae bacterium]
MPTINAAGTVPWRRRDDGAVEVALVHRPKYDDWSWSKGKLEAGEHWPVAAARETAEETGLQVRLGVPLPPTAYRVLDGKGRPATKHVRYWAAEVVGGDGLLENEIDEVAWLDVVTAHDRLDYSHDREQLRALLRADLAGNLETWPLAVVRHAKALPRSAWKGHPDADRPLVPVGLEQADDIADVLAAYGISAIVSSPSERCLTTILPYAADACLEPQLVKALSEEGFAAKGGKRVVREIRRLLELGEPVAVCSHGPVLPTILGAVAKRLAPVQQQCAGTSAAMSEATDLGMDKGEVLVAHVAGVGPHAKVMAVERISPLVE